MLISSTPCSAQTPQWGRWETTVANTKTYADPYRDVTLNVTYTNPSGGTINFWGFYDGGTTWRIRFMPHLVGTWSYSATFSDGQPGKSGTFTCSSSANFGTIGAYSANPRWFGYRNGQPVMLRSFHAPGLFKFAIDDPDNTSDGNERTAFLDWAATQGYNTFSTMFFSTRDPAVSGVSTDSGGPKLWPLNASTFQKTEKILNDLSSRKMMVYCFTGYFGNSAPYPSSAADRTLYIRYCLARFGPYWNILHSVGGPEIDVYFSEATVNSLGSEIKAADPFGHLLGAHQTDGDDAFRNQSWCSYAILQHELTLSGMSTYLLNNYVAGKPVFGQETLWMGNTLQPAWTLTDLRKFMWVHMMSAAGYNAGDQNGKNDSGFSGSLVLSQRIQARHDTPKKIWDFMESIPWYQMSPRQDLRTSGYMLAQVGQSYLCYLPTGGSTSITLTGGGTYSITWVNASDPLGDQRAGGTTTTGSGLTAPDTNDWLVYLKLSATGGQTPFPGPSPATVPGTIQAENFDNGGEGIAYHDSSSGNSGGSSYRTGNVDIQTCGDSGGGYNIAYITSGEWLEYTVNVANAGNYNFTFRVASIQSGMTFRMEADGTDVTGSLTVPNTGGTQVYQNVVRNGVNLSAGSHVLRLYSTGSSFNVNYITAAAAPGSGGSIAPEADAYVWDANPTTNYGSLNTLQVKDASGTGFDRITCLRFPLSATGGSVTSATLKLKVVSIGGEGAGPRTVEIRQLSDDTWSETAVNWNTRPAITGTLIATIDAQPVGTVFSINVPALTTWINSQIPDGKASFVLVQPTNVARSVNFGSREDTANTPVLEFQ